MTYELQLIEGWSRLDSQAEFLIKVDQKNHYTLRAAQRALRKINLVLAKRLGKKESLPRIDIISGAGKRYAWGG